MRIWKIAMFILVFNYMLNIVGALNLGFSSSVSAMDTPNTLFDTNVLNNTEQKIQGTMEGSTTGIDYAGVFVQTFLFALQGIAIFAQTLLGTAIFTEAFVNKITFGLLPFGFVLLIGITLRILFIVGIAQLFMGKSIKDYK